jgi:hypothetical protein
MNAENPSVRKLGGISTLDLMFFTAGFACGWVMHQTFSIQIERYYSLFWGGSFHPLLGTARIGWLWAYMTGLAFLIVARPFRYGSRNRPAEWLAVALAIVLFESCYPYSRSVHPGYHGEMHADCDWSWPSSPSRFEAQLLLDGQLYPTNIASDRPVTFVVRWLPQWEPWDGPWWAPGLPFTVAAAIYGVAAWRLRARVNPGWVALLVTAFAVLVAVGPARLAEATSREITDYVYDHNDGVVLPALAEKPWRWMSLFVHLDFRAWAGYSIRALALMMLAMLATVSLVARWRRWLWTEWAAFLSASIIAGCWVYDEFVARPAPDRTVRVTVLAIWLLVIAIVAAVALFVGSAIARRVHGFHDAPDRSELECTTS